jgi:hypothetical protein
MRTDLPSLNCGKGMAAAHHAGTHLQYHYGDREEYKNWVKQANGFGTVVTLNASEKNIYDIIRQNKYQGEISGLIIDPTYPIKDGETTHHVKCLTCGYVLSYDEDNPGLKLIKQLELHK